MVDTMRLRSYMALRGMTQKDVAEKLGINPRTMWLKMKKGVFGTDEAEMLVTILGITDPAAVFFASVVT